MSLLLLLLLLLVLYVRCWASLLPSRTWAGLVASSSSSSASGEFVKCAVKLRLLLFLHLWRPSCTCVSLNQNVVHNSIGGREKASSCTLLLVHLCCCLYIRPASEHDVC